MTDGPLTTLGVDESRELLETARVGHIAYHSRGGLDMTPVNYRLLGDTIFIRTGEMGTLAEGALGTLLHVEGQISGAAADGWKAGMWRTDPHESPLGGMGAMGIHMIDAMINMAGPIERVSVISQAQVLTNGLDDTTAMLCRFRTGPTGLFATLASAPRVWRLALFGSQGRVEQRDMETLAFHPREGQGWERRFDPTDIERAELGAFAAAVAGGPAYPLPVEDAIHGVSVFETMIHANASGGPVLVP